MEGTADAADSVFGEHHDSLGGCEYLAGGERPLKALGIDSDCHACRGEIVVVGAYEIVSAVYEGEAVAVAAFLAGVVTGHYDKGVVAVSGSAAHA